MCESKGFSSGPGCCSRWFGWILEVLVVVLLMVLGVMCESRGFCAGSVLVLDQA